MKKLIFIAILFLSALSQAQTIVNSRLYAAYRYDKLSSILPDFSYAGYHNGNDTIPTVNHRIFNVTDYGAIANDTLSDRKAIDSAIFLAKQHGSGIIFFPPGRFRVNEIGDSDTKSILINGSNIVFRGSGSGPGGTEIFMKRTMQPTNPSQMWSTVKMFATTAGGSNATAGTITTAANIGDFNITLSSITGLVVGDRILLTMNSTDPALLQYEVGSKTLSPSWDITTQGVELKIYHRIKSINGNTLTLYEPIIYPINPTHTWTVSRYASISEVGFEDIAFVGNWKTSFVHHRSWQDDSGYSMFNLSRIYDSWIRRCRFTDVNVGVLITGGGNISVVDCEITGNPGHEAILNNGATNVLISNVEDKASQWHSIGVASSSTNTVLHNVTYPSTTSFECHASQPRNTLLDNVEGGLMTNRAGGALNNLPNHLSNFIFWDFKQTNAAVSNFDFWPSDTYGMKIPNPIIAGYRVNSGTTTFKSGTISDKSEAINSIVYPSSLYEAQLQQRKGNNPWSNSLNWKYTFGTQTGTFSNTVGTTGVSSLSNSTNNGFLPVSAGANTGVYIRSSGNMLFELDGKHNLIMNTSTAGTLSRYSVNDIQVASAVGRFSFNIDFNKPNLADAGNYIFAVGNNKGKLFLPTHSGSVYRASDELFTALRFTPNTSATSNNIDLAYRVGSDASTTTTYSSISIPTFFKGGKYYVEVYCNNSGSSQTYKESNNSYTLPNNTFHIWVNGVKVGGDYPRSIEVNGSAGLSSGTSIALANGAALNSFLFLSNNGSSNSSSKITIYYPAATYLNTNLVSTSSSTSNSVLPVSLVSFDAYRSGNTNKLSWSTASESNNKYFEIYRSINDDKFNMISRVDGAGNSSQKRYYNFTDSEPYTGIAYYKLQQVDENGTSHTFNNLKAIKSDLSESTFTVFTASDDLIHGTYLSSKSGMANFSIYDITGKEVYNAKLNLNQGLNKIQVNGSRMLKGIYVAVLQHGNVIERVKFIK